MLKDKIKVPLIWQTILFGIAFADGALTLGFTEGFYTLLGVGFIATIVWMWVIIGKDNSN